MSTESLRAELTGSDTCTAAGLTVRASAPVLTICREMLAAGLDPDRALDVYRNGVLALRIRSLGEGAKLSVEDGRDGAPRFRRWKASPRVGLTPPMRQTNTPARWGREAVLEAVLENAAALDVVAR